MCHDANCHYHYKKNSKQNYKTKGQLKSKPLKSEPLQVKLVTYSQNNSTIEAKNTSNVPDSVWVTGAATLWNLGFEGNGVRVGVIDTGIDNSHPALNGKVIKRRDYVRDGKATSLYNPHGTHVAGTIAANFSGLKGVAPKASLLDYRVLDVNGSGTFANVTQAVIDAVNDGCHIINMSLGSSYSHAPLQKAISYAVSKNVLVVVAAGNEGANRISYPAGYPEVVSVGAVQFDPINGNVIVPQTPWFSNTNPQVDICADGWQTFSCVPGNKYAAYSGTSMSSPIVCGFAALMRCLLTIKMKRAPTEPELYAVLRSNAIEVSTLLKTNPNLQGSGFVTVFHEIPKKVNGVWVLPSLLQTAPN